MKFKFNKSSGQASRLLLVLAIVILVAVIITFLVMRMAQQPPRPTQTSEPTPEQPIYETMLGDIRFVFQSSIDRGNVLSASKVTNSQYAYSTLKDLITTEKFTLRPVIIKKSFMNTQLLETHGGGCQIWKQLWLTTSALITVAHWRQIPSTESCIP